MPSSGEKIGVIAGVDATVGLCKVPIRPNSVLLTMFIDPFGWYCYKRLLFGILLPPEHFQKHPQMLTGLEGNMHHATTWSLSVPAAPGVGVDALRQMSVCCGHGHVPGPHCQCMGQIERQTQEELRQSKRPTTKDAADVERFVGMVKYMRKFSPHIIDLTQPLWELLKTETGCGIVYSRKTCARNWAYPVRSVPGTVRCEQRDQMCIGPSSSGLGGVLYFTQHDGNVVQICPR